MVVFFLFARQVPRHVDDDNALTAVEERQGFEPLRALVMNVMKASVARQRVRV